LQEIADASVDEQHPTRIGQSAQQLRESLICLVQGTVARQGLIERVQGILEETERQLRKPASAPALGDGRIHRDHLIESHERRLRILIAKPFDGERECLFKLAAERGVHSEARRVGAGIVGPSRGYDLVPDEELLQRFVSATRIEAGSASIRRLLCRMFPRSRSSSVVSVR